MSWTTLLSAIAAAAIVTAVLMPPALRLAHRFRFLDPPGLHKRHKTPVPLVGGIVLFVALWGSVALTYLLFPDTFEGQAGSLPYLLCGALIVFLVGLSDDLTPLSAWTKLFAQVAAGLILYMGGLSIDPISAPFLGSFEIGQFSILITVLWVVLLTNAVNLIDGLDGLAAGVSLIAAVTMAVIGLLYQAGSVAVFACALAGFLAVFLFYNRYPAKTFLGDSGSLQIGFYFAVVSLLVPVKTFTAAALYLPLLALGVPILETTISISRRLMAGRNVMKADRRHLFHYLALAGLSPRAIVWIFYLLSAVFSLFALAMYFWDRLIVFAILVLFMVVIFTLFFIFMTSLNRPGGGSRSAKRK
ncbi:MAG: undecaprenyl/decaprenyl-phosphate alpha-N-acetylglucosaminyl 1-phosphate transferase [bacterium]|nr:undecaprenyl/decaprenyl-phosphate alpha-N-acetylglucosaminyl 1-phosphate transferase [bacterium]